ncbi:MAG: YtxH domain-containing protein [Candidatus Melainabacteria bacterium]|nr:YtxH domain-containing protein [Candidatus Melainabacteria bacterium]
MDNRGNDEFGKFFFGLLFGLAAGFVAGILSADRPGREVRRDIEVNSSDFFETLRDRVEDIRDQAADTIRDFKGFTDDKLRASAESIQTQVESLGEQLDELTRKQAASSKN